MNDNRQKVLVVGPALTLSGYGEQTRFALRALRSQEDQYDIYLNTTSWGATGWLHEDNEEREWIDSLLHKTVQFGQQNGQFDMSLQVTIPNEWQKIAPVDVGYTAGIETTRVSGEWIQASRNIDRIIVVSNHSKEIYENTQYDMIDQQTHQKVGVAKCEVPVISVNYPVKSFDPVDLGLNFSTDFNFLTVAQMGPRKNVPATIEAFVEEFHDDENVGLVLKVFHMACSTMDRIFVKQQLAEALKRWPDRKCKIHLLHGHLSDAEMHSLYAHPQIKGIFSLTHGEGFGLPLFEAAYTGLPVIAPGWSGQMDFLFAPSNSKKSNKMRPHFLRVEHDMDNIPDEVVWEGVLVKDSQWCVPRINSAKEQLRALYKDHSRYKGQATRLKKHIVANFTKEQKYKEFCDAFAAEQNLDIDSWLSELEIDVEEHE
jgi:glycosyltransferase involved in cell wall biosynthesis|tara:strand:- start:3488 stop:4768 length:1281 start_codon:yes stop_codon:yes gene_type:complete